MSSPFTSGSLAESVNRDNGSYGQRLLSSSKKEGPVGSNEIHSAEFSAGVVCRILRRPDITPWTQGRPLMYHHDLVSDKLMELLPSVLHVMENRGTVGPEYGLINPEFKFPL